MMRKEDAAPYDLFVAAKIKARRKIVGKSQSALASDLGLTFQQVQKYESGANRVGAGRLYQIAKALGVEPSYFFDGIEDGIEPAAPARIDIVIAQEIERLPRNAKEYLLRFLRALANIGGER